MRRTGVLLIILVVLTACGGGGGDEGGFGVYQSSSDGATFTFTIPATDDPSIAELEAYRQTVGAPPVTYILAEGQNDGESEATIPTVSVVTDDGQTVNTVIAWQRVGSWQDLAGNTNDYNEGVRLYNKSLRSDDLLPGSKSTAVLIADGKIDSVKSVFVDRNFLDAFEAFTEQGGTPKPMKAKKIAEVATGP